MPIIDINSFLIYLYTLVYNKYLKLGRFVVDFGGVRLSFQIELSGQNLTLSVITGPKLSLFQDSTPAPQNYWAKT